MIRTRMMLTLGTAVVAIGLFGAACGGGSDSKSTPTAIQTAGGGASASATKGGAIPAGAPEVDQDGLAFKPNKLTAKAGEKVYFKNSESALHTVTINGKNESGNMRKGDLFSWTAGATGEYKITCDYHPQMNATITVQ